MIKGLDGEGVLLFKPAVSFTLLQNMKIWCNIQVIIYLLFCWLTNLCRVSYTELNCNSTNKGLQALTLRCFGGTYP